jgi:hypothetical protein
MLWQSLANVQVWWRTVFPYIHGHSQHQFLLRQHMTSYLLLAGCHCRLPDLEDELADLADDEPRQRSGRTGEERGQGAAANDGYGELSDEFDDFIDDGERGNWARRKQRARTNAVAARSGLDPQALQVCLPAAAEGGEVGMLCVLMYQHATHSCWRVASSILVQQHACCTSGLSAYQGYHSRCRVSPSYSAGGWSAVGQPAL